MKRRNLLSALGFAVVAPAAAVAETKPQWGPTPASRVNVAAEELRKAVLIAHQQLNTSDEFLYDVANDELVLNPHYRPALIK